MSRVESYYKMGFRVTCPDVFDHTRGMVSPMEIGNQGDGTYFMMYTYFALTQEELKALGSGTDEEKAKAADAMTVLLVVIGGNGGRGPKEIAQKIKMGENAEENFTEIGRYQDITYYAITDPATEESFVKATDPAYAEEFRTLQSALIEALKQAEYIGPQLPGADLVGKTIHFETTDIDGRPVKSEELFAAHDITLVNFWATWCGPCKSELEELGNIHRRLEKKNAAVVGICDDAAEKTEECRALIKEKNLTYVNLMGVKDTAEELFIDSFPTSFYVDREGKIVTNPVIGVPADVSEYEKTVETLLAGEEADAAPAMSEPAEEEKKTCRIIVTDEAGSPVSGVMVQFCSDITCMMGKTDEEGIASFAAEEGKYTVHVQKAPEGYASCTEEFAVPQDLQDVQIVLKKA